MLGAVFSAVSDFRLVADVAASALWIAVITVGIALVAIGRSRHHQSFGSFDNEGQTCLSDTAGSTVEGADRAHLLASAPSSHRSSGPAGTLVPPPLIARFRTAYPRPRSPWIAVVGFAGGTAVLQRAAMAYRADPDPLVSMESYGAVRIHVIVKEAQCRST